jgi:hypothetical protein
VTPILTLCGPDLLADRFPPPSGAEIAAGKRADRVEAGEVGRADSGAIAKPASKTSSKTAPSAPGSPIDAGTR